MPLPKVTGLVWWKMGLSQYGGIYRRGPGGSYTKDLLQCPADVQAALRAMFHSRTLPFSPITYEWPGGSFPDGKIYEVSDRVEFGQWTTARAPHPWQVGDPLTDPIITLPGDPNLDTPGPANKQWREVIEPLQPWLIAVQLDDSQDALQLRAYLGSPTRELAHCDIEVVPYDVRMKMGRRSSGLYGAAVPQVWFDVTDLRDPWRLDPDEAVREAALVARENRAPGRPAGRTYVREDEEAKSAEPEPFTVDPDARDKGTRAHRRTQNALADWVTAEGLTPQSPSGQPWYDVGWEQPSGEFVVVEVKSITARNEEKQLRLGLGQVLRYAQLLRDRGLHPRPLLAVSQMPSDPSWTVLCETLGVGLVWLPDLDSGLRSWL